MKLQVKVVRLFFFIIFNLLNKKQILHTYFNTTLYSMKRHFTFLIILMGTLNTINFYGNTNYKFKHFNINNGLSQNTVYDILQDKQGFMWFGTKDGLNRFDGTSFKVFKFSPEGILTDNVFRRIIQDKNEKLWVATDDGVYIFNPYMEEFTRFNYITDEGHSVGGFISDMVVDNDGDIWIAVNGKGIFHYNFAEDNLDFYSLHMEDKEMKMITLCVDNDNCIWVFPYSAPFLVIDKKTKKIKDFQLVDNNTLMLYAGEITDVLADQYNRLIITTSQKGVIRVNTVNRTHQILLDKDVNGEQIFARSVEIADKQTLWIGTESGIYIYNTVTEDIINLRHNSSSIYAISDNAIYDIYKDKDGGVWIGSYFGGVDYYFNQYNYFESYYAIESRNSIRGSRVREFCPAPEGRIWIGTEDMGLNLFDPETETFLPLPKALQSLYTNIHAIYNDGDFLWIGTFSKGLNRYNMKTGKMVTYIYSDDHHSINHNSVFAIHKDRQNVLWIGTLSGLNIYDYENDNFRRVDELKGLAVQDIFEDTEGMIWVSTYSKGVFRYSPTTGEWRNYAKKADKKGTLPDNKVTSVYEDSARRLWITTQGGGFSMFDKEEEVFTSYNTTNGMPNDVVYEIVEDDEANLWLSTNAGLVRFNPQTKEIKNFTVNNGLTTNQFNYKSSYKTSDGTIYFGSINGFVRFNPSSFAESKIDVPVVFTELYVMNERVSPGGEGSLLKRSILYTDVLELPYHKNSFRLAYAILNYSDLNANQILYKLEGFDKDWITSKDKQDIVYSNLKPGKYNLTVKLNGEREKAVYVKTLDVYISPPFWLTGWAYIIYAVLIVLGAMTLFRFLRVRAQRIQLHKMSTFQQEKERELYRLKIDFFTNVAHEIRTPLSLIKGPLDYVIMTEEISQNVKESLQIMSKNTDRLLSLTNQLLDFRKTESDSYSLNLHRLNVLELIQETVLRFTPMVQQRGLQFELDLPEEDIFIKADKDAFLKIFSNLLNNAIKYCDNYVRVEAYEEINDLGAKFHLVTVNDGEMIPDKHKEDIFKPFVQLDRDKDYAVAGSGIGLALSKSLAELHKGNLVLEVDEKKEYIRFHLTLPVGETREIVSQTITEQGKEQSAKMPAATLLLVDDDPELLQFEKKFLAPHYHVLTAGNGVQALAILREETVNLIVSDIMMPDMDGLEFTERVKTDIEFSHIPVILLTAKVNVESKVQGLETGADAYVDKPFSLEVLLAQIANLLESREKLRESFLENPFIGASGIVYSKSDEEFIKKLHAIVHDNLDNSNFIVEDMAEQFNMSRASFYRKIKGFLNLTPSEYIKVERLKKAAQLLRERNFKVNEICYMVGFSSPSYFTKCFQQQFGILPKDFI